MPDLDMIDRPRINKFFLTTLTQITKSPIFTKTPNLLTSVSFLHMKLVLTVIVVE